MRFIRALLVWVVIVVIAGVIFIWSGIYNVGADSPHWTVTRKLIGQVRERSIALRSADIKPPALNDPAMIKQGAEHYSHMCTACHLAPGKAETGLRRGLYPRPPNLTRFAPRPAEAFWIIQHGLKMTAMPAWGETLNDQEIWSLVAYLQKQPKMSVAEYRQLTAPVPAITHANPAPAASTAAPSPAPGTRF